MGDDIHDGAPAVTTTTVPPGDRFVEGYEFLPHARARMRSRKIPMDVVLWTIKNGKRIPRSTVIRRVLHLKDVPKDQRDRFAPYNGLVVVLDQTAPIVITVFVHDELRDLSIEQQVRLSQSRRTP